MLKVKSNNTKSNITILSTSFMDLSVLEKVKYHNMKNRFTSNFNKYSKARIEVINKYTELLKNDKSIMKEEDLLNRYITNPSSIFYGGKPFNCIQELSKTYRFVFATEKNNKTIFKSIYIWKDKNHFHSLDKISENIKLNKQYK